MRDTAQAGGCTVQWVRPSKPLAGLACSLVSRCVQCHSVQAHISLVQPRCVDASQPCTDQHRRPPGKHPRPSYGRLPQRCVWPHTSGHAAAAQTGDSSPAHLYSGSSSNTHQDGLAHKAQCSTCGCCMGTTMVELLDHIGPCRSVHCCMAAAIVTVRYSAAGCLHRKLPAGQLVDHTPRYSQGVEPAAAAQKVERAAAAAYLPSS